MRLKKALGKIWRSPAVQRFIPAKTYVQWEYKRRMGYALDLKNPQTFNEKLQWLKLNDLNPLYTKLADKYAVREYIARMIGDEYLIPLIGVYDRVEDIPFDQLPEKYVLKCTHDSGTAIVVDSPDKPVAQIKKKLKAALARRYYYEHREWPYKDIKPRILCEAFIDGENGSRPTDYKFFCFDGVVDSVMVCYGRETGATKYYFFDNNWRLLCYNVAGRQAPEGFTLPKPQKMDRMFELAQQLSQPFPFVRVDLYCENDRIYFGEMTFYPQSGYDPNLLAETDKLFGSKIRLGRVQYSSQFDFPRFIGNLQKSSCML